MLEVRKIKHELTFDEVRELIHIHAHNQNRMMMLKDYYNGKSHALMYKERKTDGKSDNRVFFPFPYLITSTLCGFMNIPPQVRCDDSNIQEVIDDLFKYSDNPKQYSSELLDMSIMGVAVEQLYLDRKGITRFKRINPIDIIVVKSSDIIGDIFCIIKHYEVDGIGEDREEYVELYYDTKIVRYYQNEKGIHSVTEEDNYFKDVPFCIYKNGEGMLGDFERVIDVIDGYSLYQSEILNATQDITNALMLISGCNLTDEQLRQVKNLRVLVDENNIDAKMIYNDVNYDDAYASQMRKNIFSLSSCVDLTDAENVGNLSGSALKTRLVNLLYLCSVKANYVKEAVLRRVELMLNIHSLTNAIDVDEIIKNTVVDVKYNTLEDNTEMLNLVNGLRDVVSQETLLGLLDGIIISVDDELEKINKEKEENMKEFGFMQDMNGHLQQNEQPQEDEPQEGETVDGEQETVRQR